jgi:hypothetical protein
MPNTITPFTTVAEALQQIAEAIEALGTAVPPHKRTAFEATTKRIRQARVALLLWIDEQR